MGATADAAVGAPPVADPVDAADRLRRLQQRLDREKSARAEAERLLETKSLELYEANLALSALAAGLERRVAERTRELTEERQRALRMAEVDALTGLANRAAFSRRLGELLGRHAVQSADGTRGPLAAGVDEASDGAAFSDDPPAPPAIAAVLIDLDGFKSVNDSLGHAAGDALLVETARRLLATVRPDDLVARLGGDEFAVIVCDLGDHPGFPAIAERLLRALSAPALIDGRFVPCSCSIGVAEPRHGSTDSDALLRDADLALYASKRAGRGRVTCFNGALRAEIDRRAAIDEEVRLAVSEDRFEPWYQPIHRPGQAAFAGAELLARLHMPDGTVRVPAEFLLPVEALGLLDTMMENMLRRALREAGAMARDGSLDYLSINVSPEQLNRGWALARLPALLEETGFPASALVIEITETALVHDIDATHAMLRALTQRGMRIALDDFGIGYSNFSLLRQLPFDMLKLDRTLICDIECDRHALALVECILELALRLGIKVVAEGVETPRQAALLTAAGCTAMQGHGFARPARQLSTWFGAPAAPPPS